MNLKNQLQSSSKKQLVCKDYLVSNEAFDLLYNDEYHLLYTNPFPKNLSKYYESDEYISHTNTQKGIIPFLYKIVRNYSLKRKVKLINSFGLEKKLLDVGVGAGAFIKFCKKNSWNVSGTEPNHKARTIAGEFGATLYEDINQIQNERFSVITLWHVLEHIPNLYESVLKLESLLEDNGRLIIAVPNFESYDAKHYKEFWAAYDVPRHLWHFSKNSISKIFDSVDMEVENILPMKFDSFYVSLLSEKHKTGKNNFFKAFWVGLQSNRKARKENNYSSLIYVLKKRNKAV